ncbi:MAG: regulatory protein RecX [Pseudomonadota bacterium]
MSELLEDLPRDPREARRAAMDALARREYGFNELVARLEKRGFDANAAHDTVAALRTEGLQSDTRFAEAAVASAARRGKGPKRIEADLAERGLAGELVADAINESGVDWFELARDVRVGKFGATVPAAFPDKAKQMRFLQYRGFNSEQIRHAIGD